MWDANTMELVGEVNNAHEGQRVNCAAVGPDRMLYTGGDDKVSICGRTCCHCWLGGDMCIKRLSRSLCTGRFEKVSTRRRTRCVCGPHLGTLEWHPSPASGSQDRELVSRACRLRPDSAAQQSCCSMGAVLVVPLT